MQHHVERLRTVAAATIGLLSASSAQAIRLTTDGAPGAVRQAGRHLLNNIGVLTQTEFIVVVIASVMGFLLICGLILMTVMISR